MHPTPDEIIETIWRSLSKAWVMIAIVTIGAAGRIGDMWRDGKVRTWRQYVGAFLATYAFGVAANLFLYWKFPPPEGKAISHLACSLGVLATMFSDKVSKVILSIDYTPIITAIVNIKKKNK